MTRPPDEKGHIDWSPDYKSPKRTPGTEHLYVEAAQGVKSPKDKRVIAARAEESLRRVTRPAENQARGRCLSCGYSFRLRKDGA